MPVATPPATIDRLKAGRGRGGLHPPEYGGGDDHGPGDGQPDYQRRLYRARLALILAMGSICMFFITASVALLWWQSNVATNSHTYGDVRAWAPVSLPIRLLLWNTFVLLLASTTIEMARRNLGREMLLAPVHAIPGIAPDREWRLPWLAITVALGLAFLAGQWLAWERLHRHGFHVSTVGMSSFFYLLTGAHAVHVLGGIIALLYACAIALLHRSIEHRRIVLEVAAWYWHFMGALWLCIFALLQFFGH
jgi:cytochrome c oxidase subunit III